MLSFSVWILPRVRFCLRPGLVSALVPCPSKLHVSMTMTARSPAASLLPLLSLLLPSQKEERLSLPSSVSLGLLWGSGQSGEKGNVGYSRLMWIPSLQQTRARSVIKKKEAYCYSIFIMWFRGDLIYSISYASCSSSSLRCCMMEMDLMNDLASWEFGLPFNNSWLNSSKLLPCQAFNILWRACRLTYIPTLTWGNCCRACSVLRRLHFLLLI